MEMILTYFFAQNYLIQKILILFFKNLKKKNGNGR
jgi:hypothetical protein